MPRRRRTWPALLFAAAVTAAGAQTLEKSSVRTASHDVPLEIARPAGAGPHVPVLYIHARRGFEDEDREQHREISAVSHSSPPRHASPIV